MKQLKSFTIIEALLGVFVLGILLHVFLGMGKITQKQESRWRNVDEKNWYLFLEQIDEEFRFARNFEVLNDGQILNYDYFPKDKPEDRFGLKYNNNYQTIVRFNAKTGGHMPSLINVERHYFSIQQNKLTLQVKFINGRKYEANWYLEEIEWKKD
ncbi:MAG: ComGF family competence protein [Streptococcaceae bacterium]|jgi:competence protein ComGF|nr:ComGF family competence protein [Streptococcaceae bacterium]